MASALTILERLARRERENLARPPVEMARPVVNPATVHKVDVFAKVVESTVPAGVPSEVAGLVALALKLFDRPSIVSIRPRSKP